MAPHPLHIRVVMQRVFATKPQPLGEEIEPIMVATGLKRHQDWMWSTGKYNTAVLEAQNQADLTLPPHDNVERARWTAERELKARNYVSNLHGATRVLAPIVYTRATMDYLLQQTRQALTYAIAMKQIKQQEFDNIIKEMLRLSPQFVEYAVAIYNGDSDGANAILTNRPINDDHRYAIVLGTGSQIAELTQRIKDKENELAGVQRAVEIYEGIESKFIEEQAEAARNGRAY